MAGWSTRLKGGSIFMKDDENINSQPFMHWRDRYLNVMDDRQQATRGHRRGRSEGSYLTRHGLEPWRT